MRKTKFTETQIVKAIKDHETGRNAVEICRGLTKIKINKKKANDL